MLQLADPLLRLLVRLRIAAVNRKQLADMGRRAMANNDAVGKRVTQGHALKPKQVLGGQALKRIEQRALRSTGFPNFFRMLRVVQQILLAVTPDKKRRVTIGGFPKQRQRALGRRTVGNVIAKE